jgi:Holliday junction resolvasome RuvABC endonuclease subunit
LSYGWAIYDSSAIGKRKLVTSGHEGTLRSVVPVARYIHFRSLVADLLKRYKVDLVGLESPAYGGGEYSERHFGLMMFSLEAIFEKRKDCVLFDPATVKFLTGKGSADKQDIQRFVQLDQMNPDPMQSDEADAYCVAKFTTRFMELRNGIIQPDDLTDNESQVFLKRKRKVKYSIGTKVTKKTAMIFRENNRFFRFSQIPKGSIKLPNKDQIHPDITHWLENTEIVQSIMQK